MITKHKLPEFIRTTLGADDLKRPGGVLYSSHETLREGVAYIVGLNPGGDNSTNPVTVGDSVDGLLKNPDNAYLDEVWEGQAKQFQDSVKWVAEQLGLPLRDICASNLVFFQSQNAEGVRPADPELCWPVHDAILQIVKPRIIIALGNKEKDSAFAFLHEKLTGGKGEIAYTPIGLKERTAKRFDATIHGSKVVVAGLPHPSRNDWIDNAEVKAWLNDLKKIVNP
jgi:uracil-DNA glycosylase